MNEDPKFGSWKRRMDHVGSIALGYDMDQSLGNAVKIAALGFPQGAVLKCAECWQTDMLSLEETAAAMMEGWPRCHGARMMIETPGEPEAIVIRSRPTYRITLEAELRSVPEMVRLRRLLKTALRSLGFRCLRVEEITANADRPAESSPSIPQKL